MFLVLLGQEVSTLTLHCNDTFETVKFIQMSSRSGFLAHHLSHPSSESTVSCTGTPDTKRRLALDTPKLGAYSSHHIATMTNPLSFTNPSSNDLCLDCGVNPSTHTIRRRSLCSYCLRRFISSKILKRLESIKPRNQKIKTTTKSRFLVPLSGGVSSVTLLSVLVAHVRRQAEKTGRTGYDIAACHVGMDADVGQDIWWSKLTQDFPECEFLPIVDLSRLFTLDSTILHDLSLLGLQKDDNEHDEDFLVRIFTSARSATARSELRELLLKRSVVAMAKQHNCECILWGHSDTKLAATTLSLVAKGRGGSVASELADSSVLWGVRFAYPSRDLYKSELEMYLDCATEQVRRYLLDAEHRENERGRQNGNAPVVSLKGTSIDDLLGMYIGREGEKYPGIMANVVRTSGKLIAPDIVDGGRCKICAAQIDGNGAAEKLLCYGCERMKQDIKI